jgi:hypothetical protein
LNPGPATMFSRDRNECLAGACGDVVDVDAMAAPPSV